jgi:hypothetical protein
MALKRRGSSFKEGLLLKWVIPTSSASSAYSISISKRVST